jgi:glucan phosphoethanolaminetransferase (alkaline phosphatase superfamily)
LNRHDAKDRHEEMNSKNSLLAIVAPWRFAIFVWAALVSIDLVGRAQYLLPRLVTARGAVNYALASLALWIVVRLLCVLPNRVRRVGFALVIALPMAVQWAVFRSYGQFVAPTDFAAFFESPRVVLHATGEAGDPLAALVFVIVVALGWSLPRMPVLRWHAGIAAVVLAGIVALGSIYWRASPSLEHSQPAFACAVATSLRRVTVQAKGTGRVHVPAEAGDPKKLPNIVLVVGESLAASHLTMYGYDRPTTPRLQKLSEREELFALRDAVVAGPHTRTSVPYIVTGLAGPDPGGRVLRAPTVTQYAKARGYHTAFVSAQEESWGELDAMLREGADTFRTGIEFASHVDVMKGSDDLVVLERGVLPALRTLPEPFLLVVHMDGSHLPYGHHSPASRKVFAEDGVNSIGAYDNTIVVTDEYVASVFDALRARDPNAWMFFTSDHGQPLGESGAFYNRGYQSNVVRDPLLVFPPPAERARAAALVEAQVSACDLTPTILHLMNATPIAEAPMDCADWFAGPPKGRYRVVSAYSPTYVNEQTMLVLGPDGQRALYDLWRSTVTLNDAVTRPRSEFPLPPEIEARLR